MRSWFLLSVMGGALLAGAAAADPATPLRAYIPGSISPEAAAIYETYRVILMAPRQQPVTTAEAYKALYDQNEKSMMPRSEAALKQSGATATDSVMGGTPEIEVKPKG